MENFKNNDEIIETKLNPLFTNTSNERVEVHSDTFNAYVIDVTLGDNFKRLRYVSQHANVSTIPIQQVLFEIEKLKELHIIFSDYLDDVYHIFRKYGYDRIAK